MKKILTVVAALALTLTLASCNNDVPNNNSDTVHVTSVEVTENAKNLELEVDEAFTFGTKCVTVLPEDATNKSYTLSSSNTSVFTTSGYVITGIGEGSATLTVTTTDGGFTDTASVTVVGIGGDENPNPEPDPTPEPEPTPTTDQVVLTLLQDSYELEEGGAGVPLQYKVEPEGATVVAECVDPNVAYIDGDMNVVPVLSGETTINFTATYEEYEPDTASASVKVTKAPDPDIVTNISFANESYTIEVGATGKTFEYGVDVLIDGTGEFSKDFTLSVDAGNETYVNVSNNTVTAIAYTAEPITLYATPTGGEVASGLKPATASLVIASEPEVDEGLLGKFDFTGCTASGTAISGSTDLDTYWTGDSSLYLGIRDYGTVYLGGGGSSGAYPSDETTCIKFGTSSASGSIQLKFALGTSITQVVLTAFGWNTGSKIESSDLTINGITQACPTSSGPEELTYDITDEWTYLLTMESSARCTVHSISIYGTYDPSNIIEPESIALSAEQSEITTEDITHVDISWSPDNALLDFDNVIWTVNDEQIATISVNVSTNNVTVHGVGAGDAVITATYGSLTNSIIIQIVEAADDPTLIGKLDFTNHVSASNTAFSQSALQTALDTSYSGESSLVAGATDKVYPGSNGSGNGVAGSAACIQIGASSSTYTGYFTISFTDTNIEVARISIVAAYYDGSTTLTIGGTDFSVSENSTAHDDWEDFASVEHTATYGNSIYITSPASGKHRILLHSITFYSA